MTISDKLVGLVGVIASAYLTMTIYDAPLETKLFPMVLLALLAILSLILIFRKNSHSYGFKNFRDVALSFLLILVYTAIMPELGFILSTFLFLVTFLLIFRCKSKLWISIIFVILLPAAAWGLFKILFHVRLPIGSFFY